jgi:hypothetical protein
MQPNEHKLPYNMYNQIYVWFEHYDTYMCIYIYIYI